MVFFAEKVIVNRDKWRKTSYLSNFDPTGGPLVVWGLCGINPATELWWSILLWSQFFDRPPSKLMVVKLSKFFFAEYETGAPPPCKGDSSFAGLNLFHVKFSFCGLWSRLTMLFWKYFLSWTYLVKLKLMLLFQESFHSDNWTFWH